MDSITDERCVVGCVGTALAQIINYHQYIGNISFNYYDDGYNTDYEYHLNFGYGSTSPDTILGAWYELPDSLPQGYSIVNCAVMNIEAIYGTVEGAVTLVAIHLQENIYIEACSLDVCERINTMENGNYIIHLEPGTYNLSSSCYGYNPLTIQDVQVQEGVIIENIDFNLTEHIPQIIIVDINSGGDYTSIQEGIDNAIDSDTVLVYPGTYEDNINFNGKLITVASRYFITGDENYINETIIDGNLIGSVVTFENQEDERALLSGFTITHGLADKGGEINISHSFPRLQDLIITQNIAEFQGGGIYINCTTNLLD